MANYFTDISSWNLDSPEYFKAMKDWGAKSVVIKLTEGSENGTAYRNPKARAQIDNAKANGLIVHGYHYFLGVNDNDARDEAKFFVKVAKELGLDPSKTIMACDVEDNSLTKDRQALTNYVNAFHDEVRKGGFQHTATYTGRYWAQTRLYMEQLSTTDHWIAEYGTKQCNTRCDQWQYDSTTKFLGNATDTNIDYNGFFTTDLSSSAKPETVTPQPENKPSASPQNNSWVDALGDRWYNETGKFTVTEAVGIRLRWGARMNSSTIAILPKGAVVKYDAFCHTDGKVWIRQPRGNGQYGYLATGDSVNGRRTSYWGTFSD